MKLELTHQEAQQALEALNQSRSTLQKFGFRGVSERTLALVIEKLEAVLAENKPTPK